jgi:hypothetical protein
MLSAGRLSGFKSSVAQPVAVLQQLAKLVRAGQYTSTVGKPSKIAVAGFSFGS